MNDKLRSTFQNLRRWSKAFGVDPLVTLDAARNLPAYIAEARRFRRAVAHDIPLFLDPHLLDRAESAGAASGHYFWQDLCVARRIFETAPPEHFDVGSRIDGFVAHLLSFRTVRVIDIRDLTTHVPGLSFVRDNAMSLTSIPDESISSLSSLHAIEHFGLGRYGDPLDPMGHVKALHAMQRVLAPAGSMWISFPIGEPAVHFNGQRVLHPRLAEKELSQLSLRTFTAIPAQGNPVFSASPIDFVGTRGWCGLYEFTK